MIAATLARLAIFALVVLFSAPLVLVVLGITHEPVPALVVFAAGLGGYYAHRKQFRRGA